MKIKYKILNIFLIQITLIIKTLSKCNFKEEENKEINLIKTNSTMRSHPLLITYDYSNIINLKRINNLKIILETSSNYLSKILDVNTQTKIKTNKNIIQLCENKFDKYDKEKLLNGYNTDLLVIPFINNLVNDIKGGVCVYSSENFRPIISYLEISNKYLIEEKTLEENQENILQIIHQLIHILGFTKNIMKQLPNLKPYNSSIFYIEKDSFNYPLLGTFQTLQSGRIILNNYNLKGIDVEISLEPDFFNPHWSKNINLNDIMVNSDNNNNYNNYISMLTVSFLEETNWYSQSLFGCNFIQKYEDYFCVFFKGKCLNGNNPFYYIFYYIYKGKFSCFLNKKNTCWREYNLQEEIKLNIHLNVYKSICSLNKTLEEIREVENLFPELINVNSQKLKMINPLSQCNCKQKTIYFSYPKFLEEKEYIDYYKIENIEITDKRFMVLSSKQNTKKNNYFCINQPLKYNGIIRTNTFDNTNLIWHNKLQFNILEQLNQFQKHNHFLTYNFLARNANLYKHYLEMKEKYPNEYNYMPFTYILPKDAINFFSKFDKYELNINDLWIIKPKDSSKGKGIKILKNIKDATKKNIISEYISNPLLINGKKFDLRYYLLVTSHNPLKIYLYEDGLTRIASEQYTLDLDKLDNLFVHLTTSSVNKKNEKYILNTNYKSTDSNTWSILVLKKYLISNGINYNIILEKIKDIAIKALISVSNLELNAEKKIKLKENNLFELYAFDILIDKNLKPWLIDFNFNPSLNVETDLNKKLKTKMFTDLFNILGLKPYSHYDNSPYEKECIYLNNIEKIIDNSICEFLRPSGGFERIFPKFENIDQYIKIFELPSKENKFLWKKIKEMKL